MRKATPKDAVAIAAAVIGVPLLLLFQQAAMPRQSAAPAPPDWETRMEHFTDAALAEHNPKAVCYTAFGYWRAGKPVSAEAWLKYGARLKRFPAVMLVYGDFCRQTGKINAARRWYLLALRSTPDPNGVFASALRKRLKTMKIRP